MCNTTTAALQILKGLIEVKVVFVTLLCKYKKKKNLDQVYNLKRDKSNNLLFQVYGVFTERTEEAWGMAPAVEDGAAEPVPGGRGMGGDQRHLARHP